MQLINRFTGKHAQMSFAALYAEAARHGIEAGFFSRDEKHATAFRERVCTALVLMEEAEKLWPHNSSVIALTLRVETPCTYISANAATKARSER